MKYNSLSIYITKHQTNLTRANNGYTHFQKFMSGKPPIGHAGKILKSISPKANQSPNITSTNTSQSTSNPSSSHGTSNPSSSHNTSDSSPITSINDVPFYSNLFQDCTIYPKEIYKGSDSKLHNLLKSFKKNLNPKFKDLSLEMLNINLNSLMNQKLTKKTLEDIKAVEKEISLRNFYKSDLDPLDSSLNYIRYLPRNRARFQVKYKPEVYFQIFLDKLKTKRLIKTGKIDILLSNTKNTIFLNLLMGINTNLDPIALLGKSKSKHYNAETYSNVKKLLLLRFIPGLPYDLLFFYDSLEAPINYKELVLALANWTVFINNISYYTQLDFILKFYDLYLITFYSRNRTPYEDITRALIYLNLFNRFINKQELNNACNLMYSDLFYFIYDTHGKYRLWTMLSLTDKRNRMNYRFLSKEFNYIVDIPEVVPSPSVEVAPSPTIITDTEIYEKYSPLLKDYNVKQILDIYITLYQYKTYKEKTHRLAVDYTDLQKRINLLNKDLINLNVNELFRYINYIVT
jgi:hypothetical protein